MMLGITEPLRKLAGTIKDQYHAQEIRIFFSAPNPRTPGSQTLNLPKDVSKGANFQWVAYRLYFTLKKENEPEYYIYHTGLEPTGEEKLPNKVFTSDSKWSLNNVNMPVMEKALTPGDIKRAFPEILKGPQLFPKVDIPVVYRNSDKTDTHEYSSDEFKKFFDNDFYIVLNPKSKELKNPFDKLVGKVYPKEEQK
jgi:hypothetical protein